jgi:drug/metabolite transporter (DMT)-like permease
MKPVYISAAVIILAWSFNPILTKVGSNLININAYTILSMFSYCTGTIAMISIYDKTLWHELAHKFTAKLFWISFADGAVMLALPFFLYNVYISKADNIGIVVITTWTTAPLVTTIWSYLIFKQKLQWLQILGIIITLVGVVIMNIKLKDKAPDITQDIENIDLLQNVTSSTASTASTALPQPLP